MANYSGINEFDLSTITKIVDNYFIEVIKTNQSQAYIFIQLLVIFSSLKSSLGLTISQWILDNKDRLISLNDYNYKYDYYTTEMAKLTSGLNISH